jgi:hypothetical protein
MATKDPTQVYYPTPAEIMTMLPGSNLDRWMCWCYANDFSTSDVGEDWSPSTRIEHLRQILDQVLGEIGGFVCTNYDGWEVSVGPDGERFELIHEDLKVAFCRCFVLLGIHTHIAVLYEYGMSKFSPQDWKLGKLGTMAEYPNSDEES